MAPTSPGNCSSRRRIARDALRSHADSVTAAASGPPGTPGVASESAGLMWFAPDVRKAQDCCWRRRPTSFSSWALEVAASQAMNDSNKPWSARFWPPTSRLDAMKTPSCASVEMQAANSGCLRRCTAISLRRRKPHMASKGVSAMAISGLWLSSL